MMKLLIACAFALMVQATSALDSHVLSSPDEEQKARAASLVKAAVHKSRKARDLQTVNCNSNADCTDAYCSRYFDNTCVGTGYCTLFGQEDSVDGVCPTQVAECTDDNDCTIFSCITSVGVCSDCDLLCLGAAALIPINTDTLGASCGCSNPTPGIFCGTNPAFSFDCSRGLYCSTYPNYDVGSCSLCALLGTICQFTPNATECLTTPATCSASLSSLNFNLFVVVLASIYALFY